MGNLACSGEERPKIYKVGKVARGCCASDNFIGINNITDVYNMQETIGCGVEGEVRRAVKNRSNLDTLEMLNFKHKNKSKSKGKGKGKGKGKDIDKGIGKDKGEGKGEGSSKEGHQAHLDDSSNRSERTGGLSGLSAGKNGGLGSEKTPVNLGIHPKKRRTSEESKEGKGHSEGELEEEPAYAIKVLKKHRPGMPGYTAELVINEMKNLSACSEYEHVAALHEAWEDKDSYYLVMECCTGGELYDCLRQQRRLTEVQAASFLYIILGIVQHCHDMGVAHRDLKLSNLMFKSLVQGDKYWHPSTLCLVDFGSSINMKDLGVYYYTVAGSTQCMAPELFSPEYIFEDAVYPSRHLKKSDAWSVGVMLYVLLVGKYPFNCKQEHDTIDFIKTRPWRLPRGVRLSDACVNLLEGLLHKNPEHRLSIQDALCHPWIKDNNKPHHAETKILKLNQQVRPSADKGNDHGRRISESFMSHRMPETSFSSCSRSDLSYSITREHNHTGEGGNSTLVNHSGIDEGGSAGSAHDGANTCYSGSSKISCDSNGLHNNNSNSNSNSNSNNNSDRNNQNNGSSDSNSGVNTSNDSVRVEYLVTDIQEGSNEDEREEQTAHVYEVEVDSDDQHSTAIMKGGASSSASPPPASSSPNHHYHHHHRVHYSTPSLPHISHKSHPDFQYHGGLGKINETETTPFSSPSPSPTFFSSPAHKQATIDCSSDFSAPPSASASSSSSSSSSSSTETAIEVEITDIEISVHSATTSSQTHRRNNSYLQTHFDTVGALDSFIITQSPSHTHMSDISSDDVESSMVLYPTTVNIGISPRASPNAKASPSSASASASAPAPAPASTPASTPASASTSSLPFTIIETAKPTVAAAHPPVHMQIIEKVKPQEKQPEPEPEPEPEPDTASTAAAEAEASPYADELCIIG